MKNPLFDKVCPLPWLHLSAHLDSTMRLCCNTDTEGFIFDDAGNTLKLKDVNNIQEYFNLDHYKNIRRKMLKGEEPQECRKCFEVEKHGGESVRQGLLNRYFKNQNFKNNFKNTNIQTGEITASVQSLDLSLSNKCNLRCVMCSPAASYSLKPEFDKFEIEYDKSFVEGAHQNWKDENSFSHIISQVSATLDDFQTTGGEPFLSEEHLKMLKIIVENGHAANVTLIYHTNCTIKNERLFELWKSFKKVSLHFSIDGYASLNEYIRYPTKWNEVQENVKLMLDMPNTECKVHTTIQAFNIFNLPELYEWIKSFNKLDEMPFHIWMDNPTWFRIDVLPPYVLKKALNKLENYFAAHPVAKAESEMWRTQILSYIRRAMESYQGDENLKVFKFRLRQFEESRKSVSIESIVPELKDLFESIR